MHFTLKELCELTNQPSATVAAICDTKIDTEERLTVLSYYYVYLISEFMQWCKIGALKKVVPFEHMAPMVEMVQEQEEGVQSGSVPPVVPGPNQIILGNTAHSKVTIDIHWQQLIRDAKEALLKGLLAQRAKGDAT
jgi:hypothetical protein